MVYEYPLFRLRRFFYLVLPSEVAYDHPSQLPDLSPPVDIAAALFVLEYAIACYQRKNKEYFDATDCFGALASYLGFLLESSIAIFTSLYIYDKIHRNYALVHWDDPASPLLFIIAALTIDLLRYWQHRCEHEVEFFWEQHRVHHSSEYVNQFAVLRYSNINVFPVPYHWPAALFIPPTQYYIHIYLNIIYTIWTHTSVVGKLGKIAEGILVTPSHHRVHHGRNPYCIDKNYSNFLIIWDRMFGTFAEERDDEPVKYGLIEPTNTHNTIRMHFFFAEVYAKARQMRTWKSKLLSIVMGPGWWPGKPRLGDPNDIPSVKEQPAIRYTVQHSRKMQACFLLAFGVAAYATVYATSTQVVFHRPAVIVFTGYACCYTMGYAFGRMLDGVNREALLFSCLAQVAVVTMVVVCGLPVAVVPCSVAIFMLECIVYAYENQAARLPEFGRNQPLGRWVRKLFRKNSNEGYVKSKKEMRIQSGVKYCVNS